MNHASIRGTRACVFDAYGTLFDVAAAARTWRDERGNTSSALSSLWREKRRTPTREHLMGAVAGLL
jgi:2-haloacid dehalogenase